ncbi:major facilitator superfamily domain-containing protein [Amylocarpus encephaloides]|uniref:Major facilitator superfamily domain-containing protein n=1 Tax=Amylocarpus encephaloides TaxID=45428 RepID=A0A9P7YPH2_9HELO|nr:major facilitator superfamily domain-containing protein [Amylocarpus encephaloides]
MEETQPLLGHTVEYEGATSEHPAVDFLKAGDPDNPRDWSSAYKRGIVSLLAFMAFTVTFACIGVVPVTNSIIFDLDGKESKFASILLVTVWELGEAAGPLLIAPLSEIYGRYPIYNFANILFVIGVGLSALSQTSRTFIFARFLTGLAVASNVLNPSIIGDMFPTERQGSAMSLIMLAPLLGGAVGPAISGAIAERFGWRTVLWASVVVAMTCELLFFTLLRETYKVPILQRRAARLRKETGDNSLRCAWETDDESAWSTLRTSIKRPLLVFLDSVVLQILAIYGGIMFSGYYILATTLPDMLRDVYGFSPALTGLSFLAFSIGATGGVTIANMFSDSIYVKLGKSQGGPTPECRLPLMIGGAFGMPLATTLYGWVPYAEWSVAILLMAVALVGLIMMLIWVPLSLYIVESFGLFSASGMTMVLVARCLGGTLLPLAIPPLTDSLGLGYGFLVLAAICAALIPFPVALMRYGSKWRTKSKYTNQD